MPTIAAKTSEDVEPCGGLAKLCEEVELLWRSPPRASGERSRCNADEIVGHRAIPVF